MFEAKNFDNLLGMAGLSEDLLKNHFKLYQGYVKNVGIMEKFLQTANAGTPEFAEIMRRINWEFNGMRLHELYFGNLTPECTDIPNTSYIYEAINKQFGSYDSWTKQITATASMRGIGWVMLCKDPETGMLFNAWIEEHDKNIPIGAIPLLVIDVFEHAFMYDHISKKEYLSTVLGSINWEVVEKRFTGN